MCECGLGLLSFALECLDALAHEYGIDPGLDGGDLPFDALIEVSEGGGQPLALGRVLIHERRGERGVLFAESSDTLRAEDVGREELVDDGFEVVLAHVLPLAVTEGFGGGVAVGDAVAAGVVGDALAFLAVHPQRVMSGRAMHDPAQRVASALSATAAGALGTNALGVVALHLLELLVGDDRGVTAICLHPLLLGAAHEWSLAEL